MDVIDEYFRSVDEADYDGLRNVFADDITYHYHEGELLQGVDEVIHYLRDNVLEPEDVDRDSDHRINRTVKNDSAVVCEGYVEGTSNGQEFHTDFVDVFEFAGDDEALTVVATYSRS